MNVSRSLKRNGPRSPMTMSVIAFMQLFLLLLFSRANSGAPSAETFVFGQSAEPDTLDTPISVSGQSGQVDTQIFNTLVRMKPGTVQVEPDLATNWSVSPDGLVWTFNLRTGVTFQDGTRWNADAAKMNFDRWADKNNPLHQQGGSFIFWNGLICCAVCAPSCHPAQSSWPAMSPCRSGSTSRSFCLAQCHCHLIARIAAACPGRWGQAP